MPAHFTRPSNPFLPPRPLPSVSSLPSHLSRQTFFGDVSPLSPDTKHLFGVTYPSPSFFPSPTSTLRSSLFWSVTPSTCHSFGRPPPSGPRRHRYSLCFNVGSLCLDGFRSHTPVGVYACSPVCTHSVPHESTTTYVACVSAPADGPTRVPLVRKKTRDQALRSDPRDRCRPARAPSHQRVSTRDWSVGGWVKVSF